MLLTLVREMWVVDSLEDEHWGGVDTWVMKGHDHKKEQTNKKHNSKRVMCMQIILGAARLFHGVWQGR